MQEAPKTYHAGTLTYTKSGLVMLFFWLLWGDFCFFMTESVPNIIPLKLKDLHCSEILIGIILTAIPRTIGAICNPVISFRSDRHRGRWGRRIPFIVATMPFLVLSFIGIGYSFDLGRILHSWLQSYNQHSQFLRSLTEETTIVIVLGFFLICFDFFNTFVGAVFWYLLSDVVPEQFIARFMSWFRVITLISGIIYYKFVFPQSGIYFKEMFVGGGLLYLFGFGLMCVMVKEGEYPPPPENIDGGAGIISSIKTYVRECMFLPHYWYMFSLVIASSFANACALFNTIFQRNIMGLSLSEIGNIAVASGLASAICVPVAGWLADKFHPIRITLVGLALNALIGQPLNLIWLYWHASPKEYYYFTFFTAIFISAPFMMLGGMGEIPLLVRLFPHDRFGQFCSARAMLAQGSGIFTGVLGGAFISLLRLHYDERTAYCLIPLWNTFFFSIGLFFMILLYRSWMRYGGDEHYVAPLPAPMVQVASSTSSTH